MKNFLNNWMPKTAGELGCAVVLLTIVVLAVSIVGTILKACWSYIL
jgi:hypothetical protein